MNSKSIIVESRAGQRRESGASAAEPLLSFFPSPAKVIARRHSGYATMLHKMRRLHIYPHKINSKIQRMNKLLATQTPILCGKNEWNCAHLRSIQNRPAYCWWSYHAGLCCNFGKNWRASSCQKHEPLLHF